MREAQLYKIAIISTTLGLLGLFFLAQELNLQAVETIDSIPKEEHVKITGTITKMRTSQNVTFITLEGQKAVTTELIVFVAQPLYLKEGFVIEATGQTEEYKGKKEVIASSIVVK